MREGAAFLAVLALLLLACCCTRTFAASFTMAPPPSDGGSSFTASTPSSAAAATAPPLPPKFSFHANVTSTAPAIRKSTDSSKGAVGPEPAATRPASWPARMATMLSPR